MAESGWLLMIGKTQAQLRPRRGPLTILGLFVGGYLSWSDSQSLSSLLGFGLVQVVGLVLVGGAIGGLTGFVLAPRLSAAVERGRRWLTQALGAIETIDLMIGAAGAVVGLTVGDLLDAPLSSIPVIGRALPVVVTVLGGWVGLVLAMARKSDLVGLWPKSVGAAINAPVVNHPELPMAKILDTSVIIDGRIADIVATGFVEGPLVVPGFVLEELRHIADSADLLKRNRGRRGLDILNRIQKELGIAVQVYEQEVGEGLEVDSRLLKLAQLIGGKVVTNDYNLNKVAELQGVAVLNINELANAVKPVVLPGEEMVVHVIKDGKEFGQGVAYLDDGTMIVVDGGKKYIGESLSVLVTSVLQTAAGRMIFAKPKFGESRASGQN